VEKDLQHDMAIVPCVLLLALQVCGICQIMMDQDYELINEFAFMHGATKKGKPLEISDL